MSRQGRYAQIRPMDIANGEGIRVSIFVTGCTHNCLGCFNADYQDFGFGSVWSTSTTAKLLQYLENPCISGLTLLGGEPMQNLWLTEVIKEVRASGVLAQPNLNGLTKNIWVYSGYTYEEIIAHRGRRELLQECDVLVDGLFIQELRDLRLKFRGSSNQRIIDIPLSLEKQQIVAKDLI